MGLRKGGPLEKLTATAMYMKEEERKMMVLSHVSDSFSGSRSFRKNLEQCIRTMLSVESTVRWGETNGRWAGFSGILIHSTQLC